MKSRWSLIKVRHPAGCGTCLDCLERDRAPVVSQSLRWKRMEPMSGRHQCVSLAASQLVALVGRDLGL